MVKIEELTAAGVMAATARAEQEGRDVHAVLLLVDVVTGEQSLQVMPSLNGPNLCCVLWELFRQFVARNPELARRMPAEINDVLSAHGTVH